eukprot:c4220_g1_i1.p1 GENE.c4220_g1_i1~~c4220_g1_i1.p1  ORF type:complete len:763 (-),score=96.88 c4220_g1_i1:148-2364(-)
MSDPFLSRCFVAFSCWWCVAEAKPALRRKVDGFWRKPLPSMARVWKRNFADIVTIRSAQLSLDSSFAVKHPDTQLTNLPADQETAPEEKCVFGCGNTQPRNHVIHATTHEVRHCCDNCIHKIHVLSYRWDDVPRQLNIQKCKCGHNCASGGAHLEVLPKFSGWVWVDHIACSDDRQDMDAILAAKKIYSRADTRWYLYPDDVWHTIYLPFRILCFLRLFVILPAWAINLMIHLFRISSRSIARSVVSLLNTVGSVLDRCFSRKWCSLGVLYWLMFLIPFSLCFLSFSLFLCLDGILYTFIWMISTASCLSVCWIDLFAPASLAKHRGRFWLAIENIYRPHASAIAISGTFLAPWFMHIPWSQLRLLMTPHINEEEAMHSWLKSAVRNLEIYDPRDISGLIQSLGARQIIYATNGQHRNETLQLSWLRAYDLDAMLDRVDPEKSRRNNPGFFAGPPQKFMLNLEKVLKDLKVDEKLFVLRKNGIVRYVVICVPSHNFLAYLLPQFEYDTVVFAVGEPSEIALKTVTTTNTTIQQIQSTFSNPSATIEDTANKNTVSIKLQDPGIESVVIKLQGSTTTPTPSTSTSTATVANGEKLTILGVVELAEIDWKPESPSVTNTSQRRPHSSFANAIKQICLGCLSCFCYACWMVWPLISFCCWMLWMICECTKLCCRGMWHCVKSCCCTCSFCCREVRSSTSTSAGTNQQDTYDAWTKPSEVGAVFVGNKPLNNLGSQAGASAT